MYIHAVVNYLSGVGNSVLGTLYCASQCIGNGAMDFLLKLAGQ